MKTLRAAIVAAALAVGVTPGALAQSGDAVDAQTFARAGMTPIAHEAPRYPVHSERALEEGICSVTFDIRADGAVVDAAPRDCTSWDFEREALRVVASLRYPARAGGELIEDQEITFRWLGQGTEE
jgi:outer membrane biosynthesis protein TonB